MKLLEGKPVAEKILYELREELQQVSDRVTLVALLANDTEESRRYLEKKAEAAQRVGIQFRQEVVPYNERTTDSVCKYIERLNRDPLVHGIIAQSPFPETVDSNKVFETIDPQKDVDGLHPNNIGNSLLGLSGLSPATARAIMSLLEFYEIPLVGKHVVVVGRSRIVGKPLIGMLLAQDATVTVCHTKSVPLARYTRDADILIVATGHPDLIDRDMVRQGAVVIDGGWSWVDGRPRGDVQQNVQEVATAVSPVPGGIGPVTVAMVLANTMQAYTLQNELAL